MKIARELNITFDKKAIDSLSVFVYRKIFASHTVNVGRRNDISSYIMSRHELRYNRVSGVSCNTKDGHDHKSGDITLQIEEWNVTAEELLQDIAESALNRLIKTVRDENSKNQFKTYLKRIITQRENKTHLSYNSNIWDKDYTSVVFKDYDKS